MTKTEIVNKDPITSLSEFDRSLDVSEHLKNENGKFNLDLGSIQQRVTFQMIKKTDRSNLNQC